MKKRESKQYRHQKKLLKMGLCRMCGNPLFRGTMFCQPHYVQSRLVDNGFFNGGDKNPWVARRKWILLFANGVLSGAILRTRRPYKDWHEVAEIVTGAYFPDLTDRYLRDKGMGRLRRFSRWLFKWDRRLRDDC